MVLEAKYKQQMILCFRVLICFSRLLRLVLWYRRVWAKKSTCKKKNLYMQSNGVVVGGTVEWLESDGPQAKDNTPSTRQDERAACLQLMHLALKGIGRWHSDTPHLDWAAYRPINKLGTWYISLHPAHYFGSGYILNAHAAEVFNWADGDCNAVPWCFATQTASRNVFLCHRANTVCSGKTQTQHWREPVPCSHALIAKSFIHSPQITRLTYNISHAGSRGPRFLVESKSYGVFQESRLKSLSRNRIIKWIINQITFY